MMRDIFLGPYALREQPGNHFNIVSDSVVRSSL